MLTLFAILDAATSFGWPISLAYLVARLVPTIREGWHLHLIIKCYGAEAAAEVRGELLLNHRARSV